MLGILNCEPSVLFGRRPATAGKPESHEMALALAGLERSRPPTVRRMSQIGG